MSLKSMESGKLKVGEPSDGTNFGSTANPGIGSQFGQTKFLAIHSASPEKNNVVKKALK